MRNAKIMLSCASRFARHALRLLFEEYIESAAQRATGKSGKESIRVHHVAIIPAACHKRKQKKVSSRGAHALVCDARTQDMVPIYSLGVTRSRINRFAVFRDDTSI